MPGTPKDKEKKYDGKVHYDDDEQFDDEELDEDGWDYFGQRPTAPSSTLIQTQQSQPMEQIAADNIITDEKKSAEQTDLISVPLAHHSSIQQNPPSPRSKETDPLLGGKPRDTTLTLLDRMTPVLTPLPPTSHPIHIAEIAAASHRQQESKSDYTWDSFCKKLSECFASTLFANSVNGDYVFDRTELDHSPSSVHKIH